MVAPRVPFGNGCFAPRQTLSFHGDINLTWSSSNPKGFKVHGWCKSGPMGGSFVFLAISLGRLKKPFQIGANGCNLFLDPKDIFIFGPKNLDYVGNFTWSAANPACFIPFSPNISGTYLYGQWIGVENVWWNPPVYLSNAVKIQLPYFWSNGNGPNITTVYAQGTNAHKTLTGTLLKNYGFVLFLST